MREKTLGQVLLEDARVEAHVVSWEAHAVSQEAEEKVVQVHEAKAVTVPAVGMQKAQGVALQGQALARCCGRRSSSCSRRRTPAR